MLRTIRLLLVALLMGPGLAVLAGAAHATPPPATSKSQPVAPPAAEHEPKIATPGPAGDYLRRLHDRVHGRYTQEFIRTVASTYPATHQLNDQSLQATIALTVRWDGTIAESTVKRPSGSSEFDRAALDVARKSAPLPLPPQDVVSDDSYAHIEWTFARDSRACAAGAEITRLDDPLDVSLPRLVSGNRVGEALRRVAEAAKDGSDAGLDRFARLYLARTTPDSLLNVAASLVLAESGDRSQVGRLREALASRATVEMAVRGLHKLGVDICAAVGDSMQVGPAPAREIALVAVRTAATVGADITTCRPALIAVISDGHQPTALRLSALDALSTFAPTAARPVVMSLLSDQDPAVRGTAILASVRKGGGRPEMYRLAPMLHDKTIEVRGAASAGMVRAAGDMALDQLYLLAREVDPRPGTLVAAELAEMSTPASAEFLGKMLKRNNFLVQVAAARALAARKDAAARTELAAVMDDSHAPSEVRAVASGQSKPQPSQQGVVSGQVAVPAVATEQVRQLLRENRSREAAGWIVDKLPGLEPRDAIDMLGVWLLRTPSAPAAAAAAAPKAPPAAPTDTATQKPAVPTTSALAF